MSNMIDHVAKSIWSAHCGSFNDGILLQDDPMYLDMARAAIEAMREPTERMIFEALIQPYPSVKEAGGVEPQAKAAVKLEWQAMIKEALREP